MTAAADNNEPDRLVALGDGDCHFRLRGPEHGPLILMLHGATVPGWEYDRLAPLLHQAGYRTLVPDLYGHGLSARPRRAYDYDLFTRQIFELLTALGIEQPIDVFGHSMGAAVAARLAVQQPERIARLMLAAPLVNFTANTPLAMLLVPPLIGEALMSIYIKPMLRRRRRLRYRGIEDGRWVGMFVQQLRIPGTARAVLSLVRSGTLGDQRHCYRELNRQRHDAMLLRGDEDLVSTASQFEDLRALLPRAKVIEIARAPHAFVLTDPDKLAPHILDFFGRGDAAAALEIDATAAAPLE